MGIRFSAIPELLTGLLSSHKLAYTTGALTRLIRFDTLADWIIQTYAGFAASGSGAVSLPVADVLIDIAVTPEQFDAAGDWNGSTGTDDTAAFTAAAVRLNALGGGTLRLGNGKRYKVAPAISATMCAFSSCRGLTIDFNGGEIVVDTDFSGSQMSTLFSFTACDNIVFRQPVASCTETQPATEKTTRGPIFATFLQGCKSVSNDVAKITSFNRGWVFSRTTGQAESFASRGIDLGVTYATTCGYPCITERSGYGMKATLVTDTCGRSYFPQGVIDNDVVVISKNHEASVDCLIVPTEGEGAEGLKLRYVNTESTGADNSLNCVRLEIQDSDTYDAIFRNVEITLDIKTTASAWLGYGFELGKIKTDDTADAVDRGHIIDNLKVRGSISGGSANQRTLGICNVGTWSTGEFLRNVEIDVKMGPVGGQPTINLASLQDVAIIRGYSSAQMNITGNTTGKIVCIALNCDGALTSSTADTSRVDYISCQIGSAGNQSTTNKHFINTYIVSTLFNSYDVGGRERYASVPIGSVAYSSMGTAVNHVNGTIYVSEIFVPRDTLLAGIAILNGGTVGTDERIVGLYDSGGSLLANSALAGITSSGANAFQDHVFTANVKVYPGKYYIALQANGNTDNARMIAASTFVDSRTISQAGSFGTMAGISPAPTAVVADVGPIGYAYEA